METQTETLGSIRQWSIDRIHYLAEYDIESQFNALAISEEFYEWINLPEGKKEIEYLCVYDWGFGDQEIDTI